MILKRIEADNILRYRKLRLDDLPAHGQIAVAGPNEAGKTAIGETICFGLFGRTFSLGTDELDKVIRWGEYHGSVTVEFSGRDGGDYSVVRKIDNTGGHDARLYISDEQDPVAEGIEAVEDAVRELGGFTYQSFIDSFYLAQREMEVPHGKSATIKALIGVDKLESAAAELQSETDEAAVAVRALEAESKVHRQKIAEIGFDRAHLGRLESKRAAKVEAATAAEAESAELSARAELIGKAASSLREAARMFVESTLQTSYGQWRERREWMATSLAAAATASKYSTVGAPSPAFESTAAVIRSFEVGLAEYDKVHNLAHLYRRRLASLLDDNPMPEAHLEDNQQVAGAGEARFADRRAAVLKRIAGITHRSRSLLVLGALFLVGAILAWAGCALTRIAPESAAAGWLEGAVSSSEDGGRSALLLAAIAGTALTAPFFLLYLRAADRVKECHRRLEDIDTEAQIARVEMGVIDRMEEAALPDALDALGDVQRPAQQRGGVLCR